MNKNILIVLFAALVFMGGATNILADAVQGSSEQSCELTLSSPVLPTDFPPTTLNGGGNGGGNPG
ncbi:MAG: hypothetical protein HXS41_00305 [Theionarchaea archaeon]|nr:hypothetical protein [Theionarchaea archaeon]MBU7019472.1 hypothetical protein [Theionarchaea archaeon]MBU7041237.1 hypothetical protein [Theionarchaea archaeon]